MKITSISLTIWKRVRVKPGFKIHLLFSSWLFLFKSREISMFWLLHFFFFWMFSLYTKGCYITRHIHLPLQSSADMPLCLLHSCGSGWALLNRLRLGYFPPCYPHIESEVTVSLVLSSSFLSTVLDFCNLLACGSILDQAALSEYLYDDGPVFHSAELLPHVERRL